MRTLGAHHRNKEYWEREVEEVQSTHNHQFAGATSLGESSCGETTRWKKEKATIVLTDIDGKQGCLRPNCYMLRWGEDCWLYRNQYKICDLLEFFHGNEQGVCLSFQLHHHRGTHPRKNINSHLSKNTEREELNTSLPVSPLQQPMK